MSSIELTKFLTNQSCKYPNIKVKLFYYKKKKKKNDTKHTKSSLK